MPFTPNTLARAFSTWLASASTQAAAHERGPQRSLIKPPSRLEYPIGRRLTTTQATISAGRWRTSCQKRL